MSACFGTSAETLYVVLPYFNYCGFKRRRELFIKFVNEIRSVPGISIVISEAMGPTPLPRGLSCSHFRFKNESPIWIKENLINMGIGRLPKHWKYVAWIDADITFLNPNWVQETIDQLQTFDIVQLFQTCINLGSKMEALKIDKSFGSMYKDSGTAYNPAAKYGFWHPGYAWACTRKAWVQMKGLLDWAILGSGDRHMALAWIGRVVDSGPGNMHPNYKALLLRYQGLCEGLELSYVSGTILHHWHGSFADRRYKERWEILTRHQFDPSEDIFQDSKGFIQLTKEGQRLKTDLLEYFEGRREDLK